MASNTDHSADADSHATDAAHGTDAAHHGEAHGPLEQFEIKPIIEMQLGSLDFSFTNSALWMALAVIAISLLMVVFSGGRALVPGRLQSVAEMIYEFVANMVRDTAGPEAMKYFPHIFTLFIFILFANMLGMIPYSFTVTSHIAVTGFLSLAVIIAVTVIGFVKNGTSYLQIFAPSGLPAWLYPVIVPIEVISYLSRPVTLALRLFANMVAGHVMLKVLAGFVVALGVGGVVPLLAMIPITALEFLIAFLQAYVFAVLTCVYLNDALHPHH